MVYSRREFLKGMALMAGAFFGPWSLGSRRGFAATADTPALKFLTPSEYRLVNRYAREIIPDEPVLSGQVDVALNLDRFFSQNPSPDFLVMLRYLRLIRLAGPVEGLVKKFSPATVEDINSFKKMLCGLGYYSDANGEAELSPEQRVVWPRIGYGGPKPDGWRPAFREKELDRSLLVDRLKEGG